jgi:hypothetical protein
VLEKENTKINSSQRTCSTTSLGSESSSVSSADQESPQDGKHRVRFGHVSVREHEIVLGDNPVAEVGPPISLGWKYNQHSELELDEYESRRYLTNSVKRQRETFRLSGCTRKHLLVNVFNCTEEAIAQAQKEAKRIQEQRRATLKQIRREDTSITRSVMNSATKKLSKMRRVFSAPSLSSMA